MMTQTIHADELTEGDIIRHFTGDIWQVISEPQYTCSGITFDVLWLDVDSPDNTQNVCFAPNWRFELVSHQPQANVLVSVNHLPLTPDTLCVRFFLGAIGMPKSI